MSSARNVQVIQQGDFDRLLGWLDSDIERAARKYESIRRRLIAILASRGCPIAEDLADETIDRVARRVADIEADYVGEKAIYFLGVMNNVHHEYLKRPSISGLVEVTEDVQEKERTFLCLEKCLTKLTVNSRRLIEQYYAADKSARIDLRKRIARELGINVNTMRLRALRIRATLQECIEGCLELSENPF